MRWGALAAWTLAFATPWGTVAGEPLGLVLSGGGAKGAYEVGVWQAIDEAGLAGDVAAISGTSVGALNAALFAARPDAAEALWLEKMEEVFTLNTNRVGQSLQRTLDQTSDAIDQYNKVKDERLENASRRLGIPVGDLPPAEVEAAEKAARRGGIGNFLLSLALRVGSDVVEVTQSDASREGFIDSSCLAKALDGELPGNWPDGAPAVYVTATEKLSWTEKVWKLNGEPHDRRVLMIRASAAIPLGFDTVGIDGKTYVDGGWESKGGDNVPLRPILSSHPEIETAIVVYLDDEKHLNRERRGKNRDEARAAGVRLVEIVPSENIGQSLGGWQGVFDASPETARHLIELGRQDARKVLERMQP